MIPALTGIGVDVPALTAPQSPPPNAETPLRDLWGLLTVQAGAAPDALNNAQLEAALRLINGTEIGAALLRAIAACDIPAEERPVIALDSSDGYVEVPAPQDATLDEGQLIRFTVEGPILAEDGVSTATYLDPSAAYFADTLAQLYQAIDLFGDLAAYYAARTGQCCLSPTLGLAEYSTLTLREQLGDEIPVWQRRLEAYVRESAPDENPAAVWDLETHVRESVPDENRAAVWELVNLWNEAGAPSQPLRLNSLNLRECPPLQDVPGVTWLMLADNALVAFPPSDRLPPSLTRLDLAGNPIATAAQRYSPDLRYVTLDRAICEDTGLRDALPPHIQLTEVDSDYAQAFGEATRFVADFPETLLNIMPVGAMEAAGWSNDVMARLYPKDMLESAAAKWFAPAFPGDPGTQQRTAEGAAFARDELRFGDRAAHQPRGGTVPPGQAWQRAQQADANGAASLSALFDRVHAAWLRQPDPLFRERFTALLTKMCTPGNAKFLDECLNIAREGAASCDDQILYTLNSLHIASLNADVEAGEYDRRPVDLMHHAEDMLNVQTLTRFFADLRPELQKRAREKQMLFDEVEQWLHLHTRLQHSVHLPAMQFRMQFVHLSLISDGDAQAAQVRIVHARNTEFLDFLGSWTPLQSVIQRISPELARREYQWRDRIYNDRGRLYGALDRVMQTDGRLFAAANNTHMAVFSVKPRIFWTRYERLVDKRLAAHGLDRTTPDALPRACRDVGDDIQKLIQKATVRDFLSAHGLKLQQAIQQDTDQPRWFKRLRKDVS